MKVNITYFFNNEDEREAWKRGNQNEIAFIFLGLKFKMEDIMRPGYYATRIILSSSSRYKFYFTTSYTGESELKITDIETSEIISMNESTTYNGAHYQINIFE